MLIGSVSLLQIMAFYSILQLALETQRQHVSPSDYIHGVSGFPPFPNDVFYIEL